MTPQDIDAVGVNMEDLLTTPGIIVGATALATTVVNAVAQFFINYKPNKKLEDMAIVIRENTESNEKDHNLIKKQLIEQSVIVEYYASERDAVKRFNLICKNAITYTESQQVKDIITYITETVSYFTSDIVKLGFENMSKDLIISKVSSIKTDILLHVNKIEKNQCTEQEICKINELTESFLFHVISIQDDIINNKISRLINKSEDYLHEVIKNIILCNASGKKVM